MLNEGELPEFAFAFVPCKKEKRVCRPSPERGRVSFFAWLSYYRGHVTSKRNRWWVRPHT
jgi:hypothetical protein